MVVGFSLVPRPRPGNETKLVCTAPLGVVGYSNATVVDMVCDITLPAACLLDEILADLACEPRY